MPALRLTQLPEDAVVAVLGRLSQRERLTSVALACRRLHDTCLAPELLRIVRVKAEGAGSARALPAARSLLPWLTRHAAHVQRLELVLLLPYGALDAEQHELAALVTGCVSACGAAGELLELELHSGHAALPPLSWLPALRSQRWLAVGSWGQLQLTADASRLPLQEMRLRGFPLVFEAAARLPTALTCLDVAGGSNVMPQLVRLPNLRRLGIAEASYSPASMAVLSWLTNLSRLDLHLEEGTGPPSATLAALTGLRHLNVTHWWPGLCAGLAALQQLTHLLVLDASSAQELAPIGTLPNLECLVILSGRDIVLPHPHSLHNLCSLSVSWHTAAASVLALAAMPALAELWLADAPDEGSVLQEGWAAFWAWAAQHPPLRSLVMECVKDGPSPAYAGSLLAAFVQLWQARPSLRVRLGDPGNTWDDRFA